MRTARPKILRRRIPVLKGEFRISVAVSNQMMNKAEQAIIQSLFCFKKAGSGISNALIFFAKLLKVPIGHKEHQNRAQIKDPNNFFLEEED